MKKNTKIIVWSIVGLVVATGAFFGIRSLVKKSKARRAVTDTPDPDPAPDVKNSKADVPPIGETTTLTQRQADAIAYTIRNLMTKNQGNPAAMNKVKTLTSDLLKGGYTYSEGKAVKNAG
jgi:hypothetical protein